MAASFDARYESTCPAGDEIETGETVVYDEDDHLWHTSCLREHEATQTRLDQVLADPCPECWLVGPCEHREVR